MKTFTENDSTYTTHSFMLGKKTRYIVLVVSGKHNYISVRKPCPSTNLGRLFADFDEAVSHYKNPSIKLALTKIELGI